jgi:hypothetical protein
VIVTGLDPGTTESAWVLLVDGVPHSHAKEANEALLFRLRSEWPAKPLLAIEAIASYGMAVGREVFETCMWTGRFREAWEARGGVVRLMYRREVKLFHCGTAKAGDSNIRAAIVDRFGGQAAAIGYKKSPGPLHGITGNDKWSALAIALTAEGKPAPEPALILGPKAELSQQPF